MQGGQAGAGCHGDGTGRGGAGANQGGRGGKAPPQRRPESRCWPRPGLGPVSLPPEGHPRPRTAARHRPRSCSHRKSGFWPLNRAVTERSAPGAPSSTVLDVGNMNDWQRKSPLEWKTLVNKMVKVAAVEKHEYEGWVLTVDPVSASIVLATFLENEKVSISVVLGHAVQEVEILREGDDEMKQRLSCIFAPEESKAYSPEEHERRKNDLKTWLETNHIPVTEQGESGRTLCVAGVLTIDPPYSPEECSSSNEIILSRVQGLIQGYLEKQQ